MKRGFLKNYKIRIVKRYWINQIRYSPFRYLKRLKANKLWILMISHYLVFIDVIFSGKRIIVLRIGHSINVYS